MMFYPWAQLDRNAIAIAVASPYFESKLVTHDTKVSQALNSEVHSRERILSRGLAPLE